MIRLLSTPWPLLGLLALSTLARADQAPLWHSVAYDHVLGTSLELSFLARNPEDARAAEEAALAEIDRLEAILSGYQPTSEFSRWAATRDQPVRVSADLLTVLGLFDTWRDRTAGALDAAAEGAGRLWQRAAAEHRRPDTAELEAVVAAARETHWRLDRAGGTATRLTTAPLRLNSFAKGYILDRAVAAAIAAGHLAGAVINLGGDLVVRGAEAGTVTVTDPAAAAENDAPLVSLRIRDRAVATSGDYRRGVDIGGRHYSHLIDPRTGRPAEAVRSATVVAATATEAGALATALAVMDPSEGQRLAAQFPDAAYLLVLPDGRRLSSPGWHDLIDPHVTTGNPGIHGRLADSGARPGAQPANGGLDLTISLEIASVGGGRARRPFVAVWIEDQDGFPVRNLGLWFKGARWLPDLRSWNRADQMRALADGPRSPESISSATRGPGRYTLHWDGRDDHGQALRPGKYTVFVEAAREHGTHQVVSGEINTGGSASHLDLPPNVELAAVSLDFRPGSSTP